jgi:hypothetical protein
MWATLSLRGRSRKGSASLPAPGDRPFPVPLGNTVTHDHARTRWAELHAENCIASAFVAEFVMLSEWQLGTEQPSLLVSENLMTWDTTGR